MGVDGCPGGWLAVIEYDQAPPVAEVFPSLSKLVSAVGPGALIAIDMPIGLPSSGARPCERQARELLGVPRMASVFSVPLRKCLLAKTYREACDIRLHIEGKRMSRQAFNILPKIREVDCYLARHPEFRGRIAEAHPEVSFSVWGQVRGMKNSKKSAAGKSERRALIEQRWPGVVDHLRPAMRGMHYQLDDLHDAFAMLWSAHRWSQGASRLLGADGLLAPGALAGSILV